MTSRVPLALPSIPWGPLIITDTSLWSSEHGSEKNVPGAMFGHLTLLGHGPPYSISFQGTPEAQPQVHMVPGLR